MTCVEHDADEVRVDSHGPNSPEFMFEPFRLSRYAEGRLYPVSRSPFPWS